MNLFKNEKRFHIYFHYFPSTNVVLCSLLASVEEAISILSYGDEVHCRYRGRMRSTMAMYNQHFAQKMGHFKECNSPFCRQTFPRLSPDKRNFLLKYLVGSSHISIIKTYRTIRLNIYRLKAINSLYIVNSDSLI